MKRLHNDFRIHESRNNRDVPCDANEDELCTDVWAIKNKNTHNNPLLLYLVRITQKITGRI